MKEFFNRYFNIRQIMQEKRAYKKQLERIEALPEEYCYTFKKIQKHMWSFAAGDGYDMLEVQYGLLDLFEESAASGKKVLEVTGQDVAGFVDELLKSTKTYTGGWREKLNEDIAKKTGKS